MLCTDTLTVSHIISKITFKIFAIVLAAMLCLAGYFAMVIYNQAVENAEKSELQKLKSIASTFAIEFESNPFLQKPLSKDQGAEAAYQSFREKLETSLLKTNQINDLQGGVSVLLVNPQTKTLDWIGPTGKFESAQLRNIAVALIQKPITKPISIGLDSDSDENQILYAYPLSLYSNLNYRGYVIAENQISDQLNKASRILYNQAIITFITFCLIGFLGFRSLKRVLKHESLAKKKLKEYADLAQLRYEELETLSTVLSKSENLILLTDSTGKIEWLNEVYSKKNNYSESELESFVGKELAEVSHYPKIKNVIHEVNVTRKKVEYEAKSYDNQKNEFWASTTITPILDENGEVEKLLFIDADITRLKRAEKEIAKLANFTQEYTKPVIRIQSDHTVLYGNESGQLILRQWNTEVNQKIKRKSVLMTLEKALQSGEEQTLNLSSDNRLYRLQFIPVTEKEYVNIYGEDITEVQLAEKASRARTLEIEQHNLNITDSINYARRIQEAILPNEDHIRRFFKNSFAINKPKDIVSGDFFWIHELIPQQEYIIALADCTGHGVPGAMMSIVGHSLLNDIVEDEKDPARILSQLNREIIKSLRQKSDTKTSDGMDVSIVHIDLKKLEITFSGAYQHLYWMNGRLNVFKGDRQPIGGIQHDNNRNFTNHTFKVHQGDSLYLLSDGYIDQFGGPRNKKFMSRRLGELIEKSHKYSMQAQSFIYEKTFEEWRGANEQIDDVSIIGIKF